MAHQLKHKKKGRDTRLHQEVGIFAETLGVNPRNAMIEYFVDIPTLDHSLGDIAREYGLNKATAYNTARELLAEGLIVPTRKVGRTQLYKLSESKQAQRLLMIDKLLFKEAAKEALTPD